MLSEFPGVSLPPFPLSLPNASQKLSELAIPPGSPVTPPCVVLSTGTRPSKVKAPSCAPWCRAAAGVPQYPFGAALPGCRAWGLGRYGRPAQCSQLFFFPFIPGLMAKWQGVPMLFPSEPTGACWVQSESPSPSKFFWCFSRGCSVRAI